MPYNSRLSLLTIAHRHFQEDFFPEHLIQYEHPDLFSMRYFKEIGNPYHTRAQFIDDILHPFLSIGHIILRLLRLGGIPIKFLFDLTCSLWKNSTDISFYLMCTAAYLAYLFIILSVATYFGEDLFWVSASLAFLTVMPGPGSTYEKWWFGLLGFFLIWGGVYGSLFLWNMASLETFILVHLIPTAIACLIIAVPVIVDFFKNFGLATVLLMESILELLATPFTWVLKIPIRALLTAFSDVTVENNTSYNALSDKKNTGNSTSQFSFYTSSNDETDDETEKSADFHY